MDIMEKSLQKHEEWQGKIEIISRAPIRNREDLSLAYTPGVARPCLEIQKDENKSFELTRRANIVAVVTDGTCLLYTSGLAARRYADGRNSFQRGAERTISTERRESSLYQRDSRLLSKQLRISGAVRF